MKKQLKNEVLGLLGVGVMALYATGLKNLATGAALGAGLSALLPRRLESFCGQSVVITGGSRGLGLALAKELVNEGAMVTLLARDYNELARAKAMLEETHPKSVHIVPCDVTVPEELEHAFMEADERFDGIDMLINNAGSILVGPWETMDLADFEAQMKLHLYAPINATRLVLKYLRDVDSGKRIVNICSMGGRVAVPHMLPYDTSKFALAGFSQGVGAELAAEGISVTTIYPALMRTGSPIQAVFKGDHEKEFAWFQSGDIFPGLSLSAESAAKQIIDAARERRWELMPSLPAKVRMVVGALMPETVGKAMIVLNQFLPKGTSHTYKTGAQSRALFDESKWTKPFIEAAHEPELELNQVPKDDPQFNLGLH